MAVTKREKKRGGRVENAHVSRISVALDRQINPKVGISKWYRRKQNPDSWIQKLVAQENISHHCRKYRCFRNWVVKQLFALSLNIVLKCILLIWVQVQCMLAHVQEQGWPMPISKSILWAQTRTLSFHPISNFLISQLLHPYFPRREQQQH